MLFDLLKQTIGISWRKHLCHENVARFGAKQDYRANTFGAQPQIAPPVRANAYLNILLGRYETISGKIHTIATASTRMKKNGSEAFAT